jgi:hypothetical protein
VVASSIAGACAASCTGAALAAVRDSPPASMRPSNSPGAISSCSCLRISASTPAAGAGISIVTLSVSSSISGSFSTTASPTDFSQRWTCDRVPSVCSLGARISMFAVMLVAWMFF